jgi:hypothetical protein
MDSVVELFSDVHILGMPSLTKLYKKPTATYLVFHVLAPKSTSNWLIGVLTPV